MACKVHIAFCFIIYSLLFINLQSYSQHEDIHFERIGAEDGLQTNVILYLLQDKTGFLWIATQIGLKRYDGYETTSRFFC
jgi:ligand-binding sensor domain-containing protein